MFPHLQPRPLSPACLFSPPSTLTVFSKDPKPFTEEEKQLIAPKSHSMCPGGQGMGRSREPAVPTLQASRCPSEGLKDVGTASRLLPPFSQDVALLGTEQEHQQLTVDSDWPVAPVGHGHPVQNIPALTLLKKRTLSHAGDPSHPPIHLSGPGSVPPATRNPALSTAPACHLPTPRDACIIFKNRPLFRPPASFPSPPLAMPGAWGRGHVVPRPSASLPGQEKMDAQEHPPHTVPWRGVTDATGLEEVTSEK